MFDSTEQMHDIDMIYRVFIIFASSPFLGRNKAGLGTDHTF